jgi:hypothetical protein
MKIPHRWKAILAIALVIVGVAAWFVWPTVAYRLAILRFYGTPTESDWDFSMNTYSDRISSIDVAKFFSQGSSHLTDLDSASKTYIYEDSMGYAGCITVSQHEASYEFVDVFGANDNDSITVGRASGMFPTARHSKVTQISTAQLPSGIIRPW